MPKKRKKLPDHQPPPPPAVERTDGPPRCYGYCRVSTEGQAKDGSGLDTQEAAIRELFGRQFTATHRLDRVVREAESAARTPFFDRPLARAIALDARQGDVLVIARMDRAFRSAMDGLRTLAWLAENKVGVVILNWSGSMVDFTSPVGKLVAGVLLLIAEFDRASIIERTTAGQRAYWKDVRAGKRKHIIKVPKYGFKRSRRGSKLFVPDPAQRAFARGIAALAEEMGEGLTSVRLRVLARQRGLLWYRHSPNREHYYNPSDPPDFLPQPRVIQEWVHKERLIAEKEAAGFEYRPDGTFRPAKPSTPAEAAGDVVALSAASGG